MKPEIQYVAKEKIYPAFGYVYNDGRIFIREDLPKRIKKFVKAHELYHQRDIHSWGGWIGRELRANLIPGIKDPLGLLMTILATLSSKDRIIFYLQRFQSKK